MMINLHQQIELHQSQKLSLHIYILYIVLVAQASYTVKYSAVFNIIN